jgi:cell wall-associated NlpC family hydrolase
MERLQHGVITKHGTDLRREQTHLKTGLDHQDLRETQLSFGEPVKILQRSKNWVRVETEVQPHKEGYYQGWVLAHELCMHSFKPTHVVSIHQTHLPLGSFVHVSEKGVTLPTGEVLENVNGLRPINKPFSWEELKNDAEQFIGAPYLWGGCGLYTGEDISVDCSSLIHLLMRLQGRIVPRDASDQVLFFSESDQITPGKALYLARSYQPSTVTHVALCLEENLYLHAPQTGQYVCTLRWGKEIYQEGKHLRIEGREHSYVPYIRALISE